MDELRRGASRAEVVEEAFHDNFPAVNYAYVQFFSEHLADCARVFGGDLQQMLILAVLGQAYLQSYQRDGGKHPNEPGVISASRLADVCGIPRETVRRKLKLLEQKKWIQQDGEQAWTLVVVDGEANARLAFDGLTRRAMTRLAKLHSALETIVDSAAGPSFDAL